jgi:hypothetical protein
MKSQKNTLKLLGLIMTAVLMLHHTDTFAQVLPEYSAFPDASIGVQGSTQGFGVQGSKSFARVFDFRAGFNTIPGFHIQYNDRFLQIFRASVYAIVDYQPLYGSSEWFGRKWFISAGAAYYFSNNIYRQGVGDVPNYYIYMSRFRPYIGTGLGNLHLFNDINIRLDMGYYIPTTAATSTYDDRATKVSSGLRGLLPGLNTGITIYFKF